MFDRNEYMKRYRKEKLKSFTLEMPKERFEEMRKHAEARNETIGAFVRRAVDETLKRDIEND